MFMQELQYLFALLLGSNRKFVDPSAALDLLKGAFRSSEEQQVHGSSVLLFYFKLEYLKSPFVNVILLFLLLLCDKLSTQLDRML